MAAALALRMQGADVLVADALQPPIDKPCGEGLMPDSRRELARLGVDLDPHHGAEFQGILFAGDDASCSAPFPRGTGIGVRRTVLHRLLIDRAHHAGVRMRWGAPVSARIGDAVRVGAETIAHRWLIGADGHASPIRRWAGLESARLHSRRFGFRAHFAVAPWSPFVEIHWGDHEQAYVTPVGTNEVCIAAITHRSGARLTDVLSRLPSLATHLRGAPIITPERGAITLTRRLERVTRGSVALIGDASGSADAITGEGLAMSFRQALLLAESLACGTLDVYEARHPSTLALPHRMAALMLLLDRFGPLRRRVFPVLAAHPELFRKLLAVHVGEQSLPRFALRHGAKLGALLLAPQPA